LEVQYIFAKKSGSNLANLRTKFSMLRDIFLFYEEIGPSSWKLNRIPNPTELSRLESEIKTRLNACITKLQPVLEKRISTAGYNDEKAIKEFNEEATEEELNIEKFNEMDAEIKINPEKNFKEAAVNEKYIELFNL
jgi:hypothetical protein